MDLGSTGIGLDLAARYWKAVAVFVTITSLFASFTDVLFFIGTAVSFQAVPMGTELEITDAKTVIPVDSAAKLKPRSLWNSESHFATEQ